ncbi:MAG TPA: ABC transporter permease, partial [Marmoricola sp.]|nr:ABC transporter permease [Marmoricola sp.]
VGLLDVFRRRYLLNLITRKELRVRYRGSVLGLVWSYVKPAFQLTVFYFAMGKFMGLANSKPDYLVYLFSGIVMINFFSEVFSNATRSVVQNSPLVKKIYLPREMFPVSSVSVGIVHLLPQVLILIGVCIAYGWRPGPMNIVAALLACAIVMLSGLGLGLMFAAWNVLYRDSENFVDVILMAATWMCPVLYPWDKVHAVLTGFWWWLYQVNPLAGAVELAHYAFWQPSDAVRACHGALTKATCPEAFDKVTGAPVKHFDVGLPPHFWEFSIVALVGSLILLAIGQLVFRRLEGRFAQEL